ncbi:MAG: hypothetical protein ACI4W7_00720 [Candidatus Spyradenecus sp.]
MKKLIVFGLVFTCCVLFAQQVEMFAVPEAIDECKAEVTNIIKRQSSYIPTLVTAQPNKAITGDIMKLYYLGERIESLDEEEEETLDKIEKAIAILQERRVYCYLLWAEQCLRQVEAKQEYSKLRQDQVLRLYEALSDINLAIVTETMLAQEIATQLGKLYETLDGENKKKARQRGIQKQADAYTAELSLERVPLRKTLDDF